MFKAGLIEELLVLKFPDRGGVRASLFSSRFSFFFPKHVNANNSRLLRGC